MDWSNVVSVRDRKLATELQLASETGWTQALDPRKPLGQQFKRAMELEPEARAVSNSRSSEA